MEGGLGEVCIRDSEEVIVMTWWLYPRGKGGGLLMFLKYLESRAG
jgi:hypothetical protein